MKFLVERFNIEDEPACANSGFCLGGNFHDQVIYFELMQEQEVRDYSPTPWLMRAGDSYHWVHVQNDIWAILTVIGPLCSDLLDEEV